MRSPDVLRARPVLAALIGGAVVIGGAVLALQPGSSQRLTPAATTSPSVLSSSVVDASAGATPTPSAGAASGQGSASPAPTSLQSPASVSVSSAATATPTGLATPGDPEAKQACLATDEELARELPTTEVKLENGNRNYYRDGRLVASTRDGKGWGPPCRVQ